MKTALVSPSVFSQASVNAPRMKVGFQVKCSHCPRWNFFNAPQADGAKTYDVKCEKCGHITPFTPSKPEDSAPKSTGADPKSEREAGEDKELMSRARALAKQEGIVLSEAIGRVKLKHFGFSRMAAKAWPQERPSLKTDRKYCAWARRGQ